MGVAASSDPKSVDSWCFGWEIVGGRMVLEGNVPCGKTVGVGLDSPSSGFLGTVRWKDRWAREAPPTANSGDTFLIYSMYSSQCILAHALPIPSAGRQKFEIDWEIALLLFTG